MKNTDINEVRNMAIAFAHIPVEQDETMPFLASHPFADSSVVMLRGKNGLEYVNLLEKDGEEQFRKHIVETLKRTDSISKILTMISKKYRFTFLDHIKNHLSNDDLAICLRIIWTSSECTNCGSVFTKKQLVSLFRKSTQEKLMNEEELKVFHQLPERVIVYRGVTPVNSKDLKVLSWTLSLTEAEWFSTRFNDGVQKVYRAELPKEGALAYFSEEEIIANPFMLENIEIYSTKNRE